MGATSGSPTGHLAQPQAPQGSELSPPVPQLYQEANPFRSLGAGPPYLCFLTIRAVYASKIYACAADGATTGLPSCKAFSKKPAEPLKYYFSNLSCCGAPIRLF